jgi:hypothetical protein
MFGRPHGQAACFLADGRKHNVKTCVTCVESRALRLVSRSLHRAKRSLPLDVDHGRAAEVLLLRITLPRPLSMRNHSGCYSQLQKRKAKLDIN